MTPEQKRQVKVLRGCAFLPGSNVKSFIRDMAYFLDNTPDVELTEKQAKYLEGVLHSYRKQHKACRCEECLRVGESNPYQLGMFEEIQ